MLTARFFSEDAPVAQRAVRSNVINTDISFFAVIYVEMFTIRRERQAIGLSKIFGQQPHRAFAVQTIHALERDLLLLTLYQIKCRVREINGTIGTNYDVVGLLSFFPSYRSARTVYLPSGVTAIMRTQHAGAID